MKRFTSYAQIGLDRHATNVDGGENGLESVIRGNAGTARPRVSMTRLADPDLVELVDAVVAVIDTDQSDEVQRLREAFEPFGGTALLDTELREVAA